VARVVAIVRHVDRQFFPDFLSAWAMTASFVVFSHRTSCSIRRNSRWRSWSCASAVRNCSGCDEGSSTIWAKMMARAAAKGASGPPEVQRAGVTVANGLFARASYIDRIEWQRHFDQLLSDYVTWFLLVRFTPDPIPSRFSARRSACFSCRKRRFSSRRWRTTSGFGPPKYARRSSSLAR